MSAEPTPSVEGGDGRTAHRPCARTGLYDGRGWRTSSRSGRESHCVEAAPGGRGEARLRASHHPDALLLLFGPGEWAAFLALEARGGPGRPAPAADALTRG